MSTRALYTFIDGDSTHHVYKHHDGYPEWAAKHIEAALPFAWALPRFEADEFAAAFVAANKSHYRNTELEYLRKIEALSEEIATEENGREIILARKNLKALRDYAANSGGGVRLMPSGTWKKVAPQDIDYRYEIRGGSQLRIKAFAVSCSYPENKWTEDKLYDGPLSDMQIEFALN